MEGNIKFLNGPKGYGFIESSEGDHYFTVHDIEDGVRLQQEYLNGAKDSLENLAGADCTFDSVKGDRGLKAENIKLIRGY